MARGKTGKRKMKAGTKVKTGTKRKGRSRPAQPQLSNVDPAVHELIGRRLRVYFEEVSKEPVPERFVELLSKLEAQPHTKKSS